MAERRLCTSRPSTQHTPPARDQRTTNRLHHPEQLRNLGHYVDMFPVEACHQRYKGSTADHYAHLVNRAGGALSTGVLWRYLQDGCSAGGRGAARRS